MGLSCAVCGVTGGDLDDQLPMDWSVGVSPRGEERLCGACTRENLRAIEAKLPTEYW